jgi:hypothetical protein
VKRKSVNMPLHHVHGIFLSHSFLLCVYVMFVRNKWVEGNVDLSISQRITFYITWICVRNCVASKLQRKLPRVIWLLRRRKFVNHVTMWPWHAS